MSHLENVLSKFAPQVRSTSAFHRTSAFHKSVPQVRSTSALHKCVPQVTQPASTKRRFAGTRGKSTKNPAGAGTSGGEDARRDKKPIAAHQHRAQHSLPRVLEKSRPKRDLYLAARAQKTCATAENLRWEKLREYLSIILIAFKLLIFASFRVVWDPKYATKWSAPRQAAA